MTAPADNAPISEGLEEEAGDSEDIEEEWT